MDHIVTVFSAVAAYILLFVVVGLLLAYPTMLLWNGCLVPAVSGVSEVTWIQTWGLIILFSFLKFATTPTSDHLTLSLKWG